MSKAEWLEFVRRLEAAAQAGRARDRAREEQTAARARA
jgi:hypothetical protein